MVTREDDAIGVLAHQAVLREGLEFVLLPEEAQLGLERALARRLA